jgi:hypothetical protein
VNPPVASDASHHCAASGRASGSLRRHVHIVSLANRPGYHTILENTASIKEVQQALAARRKSVPEGQWITSMGGWHPTSGPTIGTPR